MTFSLWKYCYTQAFVGSGQVSKHNFRGVLGEYLKWWCHPRSGHVVHLALSSRTHLSTALEQTVVHLALSSAAMSLRAGSSAFGALSLSCLAAFMVWSYTGCLAPRAFWNSRCFCNLGKENWCECLTINLKWFFLVSFHISSKRHEKYDTNPKTK